MKKTTMAKLLMVGALTLLLVGCQSSPADPKGAVSIGVVGDSPAQGAAARRAAAAPPEYVAPAVGLPLRLNDIKAMARAGVSDDVILDHINAAHSVFYLDAAAIIRLQYAGVSDRVITGMINTTTNLVFSQAPPPPQTEVVVTSPGADFIWVAGEWIWKGDQWAWTDGGWILPPSPHASWTGPRWEHRADGWHREPGRWH